MTRALFLRNLRHHGRLLGAVMLGLGGFEALIVFIVAQIDTGPGLQAMFEMLPPAFRETIGSQFSVISFASAVAVGFQHPVVLAASVGLIVVAATIPAGERESGLLDLILARPLARPRYLLASLALVVLVALALPVCILTGAAVALSLVEAAGELPWTRYAPCAAGLATFLLALGGLALLFASGARRRGPAAAQIVGATLALYVVEVFGEMWPALGWLRPASPFHYFKPVPSAVMQQTPPENLVVLLSTFAASAALAFFRFGRRDI